MKNHPLAGFGLWVLYMAVLWGSVLLVTSILDSDVNTVMLHFLAGVVVYLSVRNHLRS